MLLVNLFPIFETVSRLYSIRMVLLVCGGLLLHSSCQKEQVIPKDFSVYVDRFFKEGRTRGFKQNKFDFNINIQFGDIESFGLCATNSGDITIDRETWNASNDEKREWVIFHELGHCILGREHRDEVSSSGECLSMMRAEATCALNLYSSTWRHYYMDELFNCKTELHEDLQSPIKFEYIPITSPAFVIDTFTEQYEQEIIGLWKANSLLNVSFKNIPDSVFSNVINIGNIQFSFCHVCTGTNARIRSTDGINNVFFTNKNGSMKTDEKNITLSVYQTLNHTYFYANGIYLHGVESTLPEGALFKFNGDGKQELSIELLID